MSFSFDTQKAAQYRTRPDGPIKTAVFVATPATYDASWGKQEMYGPHFKITLDDEPPYGSEAVRFLQEHVWVDEGWQKSAVVEAYQPDEEVEVVTQVDGKEETRNVAYPDQGDWIIRWPQGEVGVLPNDRFNQLYQLA